MTKMENKFYHRYQHIKQRCINPNNASYQNYGAKGVKFLWDNFEDFERDMLPSFTKHSKEFGDKNTTIERINPSGNYCKENCKWATHKEQRRNSSQNRYFDYEGERLSLVEITERAKVPYRRVVKRIYAGWPLIKALTVPRKKNQYA